MILRETLICRKSEYARDGEHTAIVGRDSLGGVE